MPRIAVINQREINENGVILVRIAKRIVENGEVISSQWHRCSIAPGENIESVIANVDANLTEMGFGPVASWAAVRALVTAEHTSEVIQAYNAILYAQEAALSSN